jgi:hypothetical protein
MHSRGSLPVVAVVLIACVFWATILGLVAHLRFGGDPRGFLFLGWDFFHPPSFASIPRYNAHGYDGQFYAALATDPALRSTDTVIALDTPSYRASHLLLPLLAWLGSLGNPAVAIVLYQALCWALGIAAVLFVALLLRDDGSSPWWALLLVPSAGLATSIIRSTPEAAALAFVLAALWCYRRRRITLALLLVLAATLARETSVLAAVAMAYMELRGRRTRNAVLLFGVPLVVLLGLEAWLSFSIGPATFFGGNLDVPFRWVLGKVEQMMTANLKITAIELWGFLTIVASFVALAAFKKHETEFTVEDWTFLLFLMLSWTLSLSRYADVYGYSRLLMALPFLAVVLGARQKETAKRWALFALPLTCAFVGALMVRAEIHAALIVFR